MSSLSILDAMNLAELNAWANEEPEQQSPTWHVVHKPPRKLRGTWRNKKMRADRNPMYYNPHDERAVWLRPVVIKSIVKKVT